MDYGILYDPTQFVRSRSMRSCTRCSKPWLLSCWCHPLPADLGASLIPLIAVPVSVIGSFAVLLAFGFLHHHPVAVRAVLAIGIVVDDAIVVVENVERHIAEGLSPREATKVAMSEVSRPIIAITLVLVAVFGRLRS